MALKQAVGRGLAPAAMGCPYIYVYFQSVVCSGEGGQHGAGSLGPVVCVFCWGGGRHLQ